MKYFGAHFGVYSSIFQSCSSSYLIKYFIDGFCITLRINVIRKISHHVSLCLGHYTAYFGYIPQYLQKLKHSLDFLHECLDITVVFTKLRDMLGLPLLWAFWVILVNFVLCSTNSREPSNIFMCMFQICCWVSVSAIAHIHIERDTNKNIYI